MIKYKSINFRSPLECGYAIFLDNQSVKWKYLKDSIFYIDGFTGKEKRYYVSFTIQSDKIEYIEVKPKNKQFHSDKYLYAQYQIPNWRWITEEEIIKSMELFTKSGIQNKSPKHNTNNKVKLNLDSIINSIKQNRSLKVISQKFKVNPNTIIKLLEDNSYTVRWSKKTNEIRYATKLIWPLTANTQYY